MWALMGWAMALWALLFGAGRTSWWFVSRPEPRVPHGRV